MAKFDPFLSLDCVGLEGVERHLATLLQNAERSEREREGGKAQKVQKLQEEEDQSTLQLKKSGEENELHNGKR